MVIQLASAATETTTTTTTNTNTTNVSATTTTATKKIKDMKPILMAAKHMVDLLDNPPSKQESYLVRRILFRNCQDFPALNAAFNQQTKQVYQLSQADRLALKQALLADYRQFVLQANVDTVAEKRFNDERLPIDPTECGLKMEEMIRDEEKRILESKNRIDALTAARGVVGVIAKNKRTAEAFDETLFTLMPKMNEKEELAAQKKNEKKQKK